MQMVHCRHLIIWDYSIGVTYTCSTVYKGHHVNFGFDPLCAQSYMQSNGHTGMSLDIVPHGLYHINVIVQNQALGVQ